MDMLEDHFLNITKILAIKKELLTIQRNLAEINNLKDKYPKQIHFYNYIIGYINDNMLDGVSLEKVINQVKE